MKHKLWIALPRELLAFFADLMPKLSQKNQHKLLKQGEMFVNDKTHSKITLSENKPKVHKAKTKYKER